MAEDLLDTVGQLFGPVRGGLGIETFTHLVLAVTTSQVVALVTMVVFGGMASTFGAVVGAAVLTVLPQALTLLKDYEMVVFGALMMLTMIFFPRGVVPTLGAYLQRRAK